MSYTPDAGGTAEITIRATDTDGAFIEDTFTVTVNPGNSEVVSHYIFYNNSALDGNDLATNVADDAAIDSDKTVLLPGQAATPANYSSYSRGINGIMVDIDGLANGAGLNVEDFEFRTVNTADPGTWAVALPPISVTVRPGQGVDDSDRVTLIWVDGAVSNQWLEVTVRATDNTGLAGNDVFYFGNVIGDTDGSYSADSNDLATTVGQFGLTGNGLTSDFDCDGRVNLIDFTILRNNFGHTLSAPILAPEASSTEPSVAATLQVETSLSMAVSTDQDTSRSIQPSATPVAFNPVIPVIGRSLGSSYPNGDPTASAMPESTIDLLFESPYNYFPEHQPVAINSSTTELYRAITAENNLLTSDDGLLSGSSETTIGDLYALVGTDDLLPGLLAESPVTIALEPPRSGTL